jgi:hypothetical protein
MILKTSYRRDSVKALTEYISRREHLEIRDREGNVMDREQLDQFVEQSKDNKFEREFIISPDDHDIALDNLDHNTRESMEKWIEEGNRTSVDYVYAIHYDTQEHPHAHIAMTGKARDLKMHKPEIEKVQEIFRENFKEAELHKGLYLDNPLREQEEELEKVIGL